MNPCSLKDVRAELLKMNLQPRRQYGQNFLIDRNILDIILAAAEVSKTDRVLEVGPGLGVLTVPISEACEHLICVEKDFKLTDFIRDRFDGVENVEIMGSDIMRVDVGSLDVNKCVSNLPYSCGSRFLVDFTAACTAERIVVMVQDEVARKMYSKPGNREFSLMGLMMQIDYEVELVKTVKPGCFWPRPDVDSCVVRLQKLQESRLSEVEKIFLRKFAKNAFSQRRKKIGVLLRTRAGHDREAAQKVSGLAAKRPEELTMAEWCFIASALCGR